MFFFLSCALVVISWVWTRFLSGLGSEWPQNVCVFVISLFQTDFDMFFHSFLVLWNLIVLQNLFSDFGHFGFISFHSESFRLGVALLYFRSTLFLFSIFLNILRVIVVTLCLLVVIFKSSFLWFPEVNLCLWTLTCMLIRLFRICGDFSKLNKTFTPVLGDSLAACTFVSIKMS